MDNAERKKIENMIKKHLRQVFLHSSVRREVLLRDRVEGFYEGTRRRKVRYVCGECGRNDLRRGEFDVDHIEEVGSFTGDWNDYIERMLFCGLDNLVVLCKDCHKEKTAKRRRELSLLNKV